MKIAVVGSGIAGMTAAWLLSHEHAVTLFEAGDRLGGHTNTIDVELAEGRWAVDTGFIVFNDWTYPKFIALMERLGVPSQASCMSLSVRCERTGLEYSGRTLGALFAQRRNAVSPTFYRMLLDILRFNREAKRAVRAGGAEQTMGAFIREKRYSRQFYEHYLLPMLAAIWSTDPERVEEFPARFILHFFENHGLLNLINRPQWRVIRGGSREYIGRLTAPYQAGIRLNAPVVSILRGADKVQVQPRGAGAETFDHVVIAAHSDQALAMLGDPSDAEREVLGAIVYQPNEAVLHTDTRMMPRLRGAWASWNYRVGPPGRGPVAVTYHMNRLQGLEAPLDFFVSLNDGGMIDPDRVLRRIPYAHPLYTRGVIAAQARHGEISGVRRTHYCGAYWGNGFHEDGVVSALAACRPFGLGL